MRPLVTPLVLLALLTGPYLVARARGVTDPVRRAAAGRLGACLLFCFTGVGHFLKTEEMAAMLPGQVPARPALVLATGVLEIAAGLALLPRRSRRVAGLLLLGMLAAFLPVNVHAALERVPFGGHEHGPLYLLLRVPLQLAIAAWVHRFAVARAGPSGPG